MSEQPRPVRADGRRNRERILAAAAQVVARDGAGASLEEIARRAGVGSATLHRHFRSRDALLDEVFRDGVEQLRHRADRLAAEDPAHGLMTWLAELAAYTAGTRGLAASLAPRGYAPAGDAGGCHDIVRDAAASLAALAERAGTLRPGVAVDDLLDLVNGIAIAAEPDPRRAARLFGLAMAGLRPPGPPV
ncbi:TetR/AcrR family transcriptional regulator [Dactylosporangium sp. CA-092794]|uniref:TetR/AcrR family transcriptional regulator n=1 Tax=Dactylosporangium sp. CA-092794 TaxID=3239929 RepID=UPI003D8FD797